MRLRLALIALASIIASNSAEASVITYTASGTGTNGPLSAQADFTTSNGQLLITLTNTLAASVIRSSGQALSGINLTLSNGAGNSSVTGSAQLGNVSSGGTVTYTSGGPTRWVGSLSVTGNAVNLTAIGGGQPSQLIAPTIANAGTYTNANNGFGNFSPYIIGPATFTLSLGGVTANTRVTAATFAFGTGPDNFISGTATSVVPEPSMIVSMATGLIGLGSVRVLRHRRQAVARA